MLQITADHVRQRRGVAFLRCAAKLGFARGEAWTNPRTRGAPCARHARWARPGECPQGALESAPLAAVHDLDIITGTVYLDRQVQNVRPYPSPDTDPAPDPAFHR